jgi:hypothetical protein
MALASILPGEGRCFQELHAARRLMDGASYVYGVWGTNLAMATTLGAASETGVQQPGENGVNTTFQYVREGWTTHWRSSRGGLNKSLRSSMSPATTGRLATASGTANLVCELVVWTPWRVAGRVHHDVADGAREPTPNPDDWVVVVDTVNTTRVTGGDIMASITMV